MKGGTMRTRIYEWTDGAWREVFSHTHTPSVVTAFAQAIGRPDLASQILVDVEYGSAFEATDPAGVRGLVCTDDSPHRPNVGVAS